MRRPSVSETCIISSSKLTDFANALVGTKALADLASVLTKVLIPNLQETSLVLLNQPVKLIQLPTRKSVVGCELRRIKPELRFVFGSLNVDMRRLFALIAKKVEAKSAYP